MIEQVWRDDNGCFHSGSGPYMVRVDYHDGRPPVIYHDANRDVMRRFFSTLVADNVTGKEILCSPNMSSASYRHSA